MSDLSSDALPLISHEIVIRNAQPTFRLCLGGVCVEDRSGTRAHAALEAMVRSRGLELSSDNRSCRRAPQIGPVPDGRYGEPGT